MDAKDCIDYLGEVNINLHGVWETMDDDDCVKGLLYGAMTLIVTASEELGERIHVPSISGSIGTAMYHLACASHTAWQENDEESRATIAAATETLEGIL